MSTPTSMLTCHEVIELLSDYLDGNLPIGDRARVRAHLDGCDGCEGFVEQIRATIRIAGRVQPEVLSQEARERLIDAFRDWKTEGTSVRTTPQRWRAFLRRLLKRSGPQ